MKRISILISILFLLALGIISCDKKDKPTTGGGGDNSVTISGTVDIDGVTLTIYERNTSGKVFYGPTAIGTSRSYSARFNVSGETNVWMLFSKSGCNDAAKGIDVRPGANINVGGASLLCG